MSPSKRIAFLAAVILIAAGSGAWIGHICTLSGSSQSTEPGISRQGKEQTLVDRIGGLEADRQRLEAALSQARSRIEQLEDRIAVGGTASDASSARGGKTVAAEEGEGAPDPGPIDWKNLYNLFSKNALLIARVCEIEKEKKDPRKILSPQEIAAFRETQAEWVKVASQAHVLSKYPVIDSKILPEVMKASLGAILGLSEDQMATIVAESMGDPLSRDELESATPLEAFAERLDLVDRMGSILPEVLDDTQLQNWQRVQERMLSLFRGEPKVTRVGFDCKRENLLELVTRAWRESYDLPEAKQNVLDGIAEDYVQRAREVFQRHGDPRGHLQNLERPLRENLETDLLALQLEVEHGILQQLTPEQAAKLVGKTPWLVQFELSTAVSLRTGESVGF
jgi:hypothetical protein